MALASDPFIAIYDCAGAEERLDAGNRDQRDLAELVSLPFRGLSNAALDEVLSDDSLQHVRQLRQRL